MAEVLVIGGGAAGLESALCLADNGREVIIIEKNDHLGGKAAGYCCKASDECRKCGACLVTERVYRVKNHPSIKVMLNSTLLNTKENSSGYLVSIQRDGQNEELEITGIIAAIGFDTINPLIRGEFHYGRSSRVITARELEEKLNNTIDWETALGISPRIAFIQCFGSREASRGVSYCSRVCCLYTEKLAHILLDRLEGSNVDVFFMDRQKYAPVYQAGVDGSINYVRGMPSRVEFGVRQQVALLYENVQISALEKVYYDWIVLCPAVVPGENLAELAEMLGLPLDGRGFLMIDRDVPTRGGILAAGSCTGPQTIIESIGSGQAAGLVMLDYLKHLTSA